MMKSRSDRLQRFARFHHLLPDTQGDHLGVISSCITIDLIGKATTTPLQRNAFFDIPGTTSATVTGL
jgi:hypothetical protein